MRPATAACRVAPPVSSRGLPSRDRTVLLAALPALLATVALLGLAAPETAGAARAPACAPATLNTSAALAGGAVTVSPTPGSVDASYRTQLSFVGVPAAQLAVVSVTGSRSGRHAGALAPYSQGDGASFVLTRPLAEGELVTVKAALRQGGGEQPFQWSFTTAQPDRVSRSLETPPPPPPPPRSNEIQHFVSRQDLKPPSVSVTTNTGAQAPGDLFLAPYAGPGPYGPMILDAGGGLVWFKPVPKGARAANLRLQEYRGRPVLTWWQDPLVSGGRSGSGVVIADRGYREIAKVRAGNGFSPDLHAFEISPQGTALFTVYDAIRCNLSRYGGPADGGLADTLFQEIDLATGLVRFEWHALDHVPLASSYMPARPGTPHSPWDFFHINAISSAGGAYLVDSRNTWAAYRVDPRSGVVAWTLGGKQSSFAMGPGATPAWQHDARLGPNETVTFFDNGATPAVHRQSRVIVLQLDRAHMTANLVTSFNHPTPLVAPSQGNFQALPGGDWMAGWGQEPWFTEYSPSGQVLFDAHLPSAYQSFTVLKFPWATTPPSVPTVAARRTAHGALVYASWNGATEVVRWRLLGGAGARSLAPLAEAPRTGFETRIALARRPRWLAAQALDAAGRVLGTSRARQT